MQELSSAAEQVPAQSLCNNSESATVLMGEVEFSSFFTVHFLHTMA